MRRSIRILVLASLLAGLALFGRSASAQVADPNLWVTNGIVTSLVRDGNTLYVGGQFSRVGPSTGGVPFDAFGTPTAGFPLIDGTVEVAVSDGSGGWYVGGQFTRVGAVARRNLAHIASDNSVVAWDPSPDAAVHALVLDTGTLFVGGSFNTIGGQTRKGIAAIDVTTGLATSWYPGDTSIVYALALSGSTLYIGGNFCCIGGTPRSDIGAVDKTTGALSSWNPNANFSVLTLGVSATTVYAGGIFSSIGGQSRNRLAALDKTTGLATAWDPSPNGTIYSLAFASPLVYVGGVFSTVGGQSRNNIAALNVSDGLATSWNPNANSGVYDLSLQLTTVYAGGDFTSVGGQSRNRAAGLDVATGNATSWNPGLNGHVEAVGTSNSDIFVGGPFTSTTGVTRNNIAALDLTTGMATAWNPNANSPVRALVLAGTTLYAGGDFTSIGGQSRNRIAALDVGTGLASSWNPNSNNSVWALVLSGTTLYAGGQFTSIGGQTRNRLAALDVGTGLATAWDPNANNFVLALLLNGTTLYAGGDFTSIGGQSRNRIAALDVGTGLASAWDPNANTTVRALAQHGTTVFAGGAFTTIGGQTRLRIAGLDATTGLATAWNPGANNPVYVLSKSGTTLYAGGAFTSISGQNRARLAALDVSTGVASGWNPSADNIAFSISSVFALSVGGTTVHVGGDFGRLGIVPESFLGAVGSCPALTSVVPASGGNAGSVTVTVYGTGLGAVNHLDLVFVPTIPATNLVVSADGTSVTGTFDLAGAPAGALDVRVSKADGQSALLASGFTVTQVAAPQLRVAVVGPSLQTGSLVVRRDRRTAFDLVIENPGNVDALNVPLWVAGIPLDATVELDFALGYPPQAGGEPAWNTVPLTFTTASGKYVALVIPRVPPGATTRRIYLTVPGPVHAPFQLIGAVSPPWEDGAKFRSCLNGGGVIANPACMGIQLDAINAYLLANPQLQALSGIAFWAKEAWQCEGAATLPAALVKSEQVLDYLAGGVENGTSSPGCVDVVPARWRDLLTVNVVSSVDPNEKIGAAGIQTGGQALPYSIRFENLSGASAPAQDVVISDPLDANVLDVNTVSLGAINFGSVHVYPPPGLSSYSTTVDLRPGKNLLVNVSATLDPFTHVLTWSFNSIDPVTGRTPVDPSVGFLPPNAAPPQGEGSALFTVLPKPGIASGTMISNGASILFDDPPATNTPNWVNGFDNTPPASHVLPLAGQSNQPTIPVTWTADGAPPDLRDFTIYVKEDASPYRVWRLNTSVTADTLAPPPDHKLHTYSFYSVARDQVGNIETSPGSSDATTQSTTSVGTPGALALALEGARPNPSNGAMEVWFTLPDASPATLELLDVMGRRVMRREVGTLGPGVHGVTLSTGTARAGLYFLRLSRAGDVRRSRVAVLR